MRHDAVVGPNAIVQTGHAVRALLGQDIEQRVFASAGLTHYMALTPAEMVDENDAYLLFASVRSQLDPDFANTVLADAGRRTARYIIANRIPSPVKRALAILPAALGSRMLLSAIYKNAWTFAGSGDVSVRRGARMSFAITGNPLATPGCPWHLATFEELFSLLISPRVRVRHTRCCARGDSLCEFSIAFSKEPLPSSC